MQISDTTDNQGALQDVHFFCKTNSTSYPTKDIIRNGNRWLYRAICWALEADPTWDDTNLTTLNEVTTTLVDSQADYGLPSNLIKLKGVWVKNAQGDYVPMQYFDPRSTEVNFGELWSSTGMPSHYRIIGNSIVLGPAPSSSQVTTSAGLKLELAREIDLPNASDTTQELPLGEPFDRIWSYGASYDYLIVNGPMERAQTARAEIEAIKRDMVKSYSSRYRGQKTRIRGLFEKVRDSIIL